jgi:hypothetical protein
MMNMENLKMFNLIESNNIFIGQTKYGEPLYGKYDENIDPRGVYTLIYELRQDGKNIPQKIIRKFTGEHLIFNHFSSKKLISGWQEKHDPTMDPDRYFTGFLHNLVVMGCYPSILGKSIKTSKLIQKITGSPKTVTDYIMNDPDYIDEILCCYLYTKIKNGYNSVYCIDHLFDWKSEFESSEFLDKFIPSQLSLKNRSFSGYLQFKGSSGFVEVIPFNTEAIEAETFN